MGWDGKGEVDDDKEELGNLPSLGLGRGEVGAQDSSSCDKGCLTHRQQGWGTVRNQTLAVPLASPCVREDMKDMENLLSAQRSSPEVEWPVLEVPAHLCRPYWMAVSR